MDGRGERSAALRQEVLFGLELTALTAFTFSRPVLDAAGGAPVVFTARQVGATTVLLWAIVVVMLPAAVFVVAGALTRPFGRQVRPQVHAVLVGVLAGLGGWRLGADLSDRDGSAPVLIVLGLVIGAAVGWCRWWPTTREPVRTFLRYAAVAPVIFLGQFVFLSETGDWAFWTDRAVDVDAATGVAEALGEDPPPVVMIILDELPTATLLDEDGGIDADLFPNLAGLAEEATWYRNHTTVASYTWRAVPSLVTGSYTGDDDAPLERPANLFTMLGEAYDVQVSESVTDLCPSRYCPRGTLGGMSTLLGETPSIWRDGARELGPLELLEAPGLDEDRVDDAESWIAEVDLSGSAGSPPFVYSHILLPHTPWRFTEDGSLYEDAPPYGSVFFQWSEAGVVTGGQRQVLQTQVTDRLVGQLLDRVRDAGLWDDALIVLTSDHGFGFEPGEPLRDLSEGNLHHILWTPLLVKAPGQSEGAVDDSNVEMVDVLPTIAHVLGVELPWDVDGLPAGTGRGRDPAVKTAVVGESDRLDEGLTGDRYEVDAPFYFEQMLAGRLLEGTGPDAPWERTRHAALLRRPVDEIDMADPAGSDVALVAPDGVDGLHREAPRPLVLYGRTDLDVGTVVAFGLNGRIAALTEVEPGEERPVHGLLVPDLYEDGDNELTAYVVEGEPGGEVLRPLGLEM